MIHCVHHVPGRMRVKSPLLKGNPQHAKALEDFLQTVDGVGEASANTVTGSVVVRYAVAQTNAPIILDRLKTAGFLVGTAPARLPSEAPSLSRTVGQRVVDSMVEKIVERSAVALISALI